MCYGHGEFPVRRREDCYLSDGARGGKSRQNMKVLPAIFLCAFVLAASPLLANSPGGTNGSTTPVTITGSGTVTMANGIVSLSVDTGASSITAINYTYNNGGGTTTTQLLSGGTDGGELYWEFGTWGGSSTVYSVVANTPKYGEIDMLTASPTNGTVDIHFSMLQGSPGFYVTAIWSTGGAAPALALGETRDNIYAGSIFNWMCVDANRNKLMEVTGGNSVGVLGAPVEVSLWTTGLYAGRYEDKYKYSADFATERVWGWASVTASTGTGGHNVGLWNVLSSVEYYNGGPTKRELMSHIGTTILNMTHGGHYGGGAEGNWNAGEVWTHCYGPWFIYCNNVTNKLTNPAQAAAALYADAQAQAAAEATAWPYSWLTNAAYAPATNRGTITGKFIINDTENPNASAAGLEVGVVQQPSTDASLYDWQQWTKPYQFWVKADTNGNFTIPNVIATNNYTLYAYGPGAAGMFMSQNQTGANPPLTYNLPAVPFSVTVKGGATTNLGTVTWTPTRVGPTVFEIGYPSRTAEQKFRHGDDWWVGDIGPSSNAPSPIWSKWLEYPFDFPNGGPNYTVGQSRWSTDWNFIQPVVTDAAGNYDDSTSTITFTLASVPTGSASLYLAIGSDYEGPVVLTVNNNNLANESVTSTPATTLATTGYFPAYNNYESDANIREGPHGVFSDERFTFAASLLKSGVNTINIGLRSRAYFANHFIYDYIRLELTGYVPPAPAKVTAWPGNNCNLLSWPVTPGATSYKILRSTTSRSGFASIGTNVGPVCGSGSNNAAYLDTNALNGTNYYYAVQSVNPVNTSINSTQSAAAMPSAGLPAAVPAAPTGVAATAGHTNVVLLWSASPGANYYSVWRSTLVNTGGGSTNVLSTNILSNSTTNATFTDTAVTDGTYYSYFVTAANAAGTSGNSAAAYATPLPSPPESAPTGFAVTTTVSSSQTSALKWTAVPGAVGYIVFRSTSPGGPFTFPNQYLMSITETTYTDVVTTLGTYYYVAEAMNAAGVSSNSAFASSAAAPSSATTTTLARTAGANPSVYGDSLTFQATVSPTPPNGQTVNFYTGSTGIGMATTIGGVATLTLNNLPYSASAQSITASYLGNATNTASTSAAVSQTVTQGTLTYVATPASRAYGAGNPTFSGTVTGFVNGETLGIATSGTIDWIPAATATSLPGSYAINGSGLTAKNYALAQATGNATALTVLAPPQPVFLAPTLSGDGLVFSGSNGPGYGTYYLLTSTNLATPLSNWGSVLTNFFDPGGNFNFTNPPDPTQAEQFFILQLR